MQIFFHRVEFRVILTEGFSREVTAASHLMCKSIGVIKPPIVAPPEGANVSIGSGSSRVWKAPESSAMTQERLSWKPPQRAGMIEDLDHMDYSAV